MKDDFGQQRISVTKREVAIGVLFLMLAAVGAWSVALPSLDQDATKQPDDAAAHPPADTTR